MSTTEVFKGDSYEIVAWAREQSPLLFEKFGSYTDDWLLLARNDAQYFIYKDCYGSCGGCDAFEGTFDWADKIDRASALEFAKDYPPFIEIPRATMRNLIDGGNLAKVFPGNIRGDETDLDNFVINAQGIVKIEEDLPITLVDVLQVTNQEVKQKLLKKYGYEAFVRDSGAEVLHEDGDNRLIKVDEMLFIHVKDGSTPRRYLLRVPPTMKRTREAIAWTFGMKEDEYQPLVET